MTVVPFNPLDMTNLGASISNAILATNPTQMTQLSTFEGAGIYAIYYVGDFPAYQLLAEANQKDKFGWPIYVGKAEPEGRRTGQAAAGASNKKQLFERLKKHKRSVEAANNLMAEDFWVRWLAVEQIWTPLGETALITRYSPVWNTIVPGFGNNDPGGQRTGGMMSRWDTLHPGRSWGATGSARSETPADISADAEQFLRAWRRN